jgi:hypothetical protein
VIGGADRRALDEDDADQPLLRVVEVALAGDAAPVDVADIAGEQRRAVADARRVEQVPRIPVARMGDAAAGPGMIGTRPER